MTDKPESETTAGLSVGEVLPIVAWQDGDFVQSEQPVDLCSGDASAWIPLTLHAPAQATIVAQAAEIERLTRERDAAWGEAVEIREAWNKAEDEIAAQKVADIDEVMRLAGEWVTAERGYERGNTDNEDCDAAREALRSALAARGME